MHKILIIDDDKDLCALIRRRILSENIEADCCHTGTAGLDKLSACHTRCDDVRDGRL